MPNKKSKGVIQGIEVELTEEEWRKLSQLQDAQALEYVKGSLKAEASANSLTDDSLANALSGKGKKASEILRDPTPDNKTDLIPAGPEKGDVALFIDTQDRAEAIAATKVTLGEENVFIARSPEDLRALAPQINQQLKEGGGDLFIRSHGSPDKLYFENGQVINLENVKQVFSDTNGKPLFPGTDIATSGCNFGTCAPGKLSTPQELANLNGANVISTDMVNYWDNLRVFSVSPEATINVYSPTKYSLGVDTTLTPSTMASNSATYPSLGANTNLVANAPSSSVPASQASTVVQTSTTTSGAVPVSTASTVSPSNTLALSHPPHAASTPSYSSFESAGPSAQTSGNSSNSNLMNMLRSMGSGANSQPSESQGGSESEQQQNQYQMTVAPTAQTPNIPAPDSSSSTLFSGPEMQQVLNLSNCKMQNGYLKCM